MSDIQMIKVPELIGAGGAFTNTQYNTLRADADTLIADLDDLEADFLARFPTSGSPTLAAQPALGTSGATTLSFGTDVRGVISITPSGTGITSGALVNVSFAVARPDANYIVQLTPSGINSAALRWYANDATYSTTGWSLRTIDTPVSGTNYRLAYWVVD